MTGGGEDQGTSTEALTARLGTTVGGYRLEALLGVGGTAAVYKGVKEGASPAAVKVLHAWLGADPRARKRFLREAAVAGSMSHPSIVRMLESGEDAAGLAYLIMELAEGETLEERRASSGGCLPLDEVLRFTDDLLSVLATAHQKGVVHRDIKPANLLVSGDRLRVLDFGIARATELSDVSNAVTRTGAVLGTALFMPPEQALGVRDEIDARTDVWAVGATMFTLLTGRFVHRARTVNEALVLAATQPAPSLRSVSPAVPPAVAAVVDRALSFERSARYPDAAAMRAALDSARRGQTDTDDLAAADTLPDCEAAPRAPLIAEHRAPPPSAADTLPPSSEPPARASEPRAPLNEPGPPPSEPPAPPNEPLPRTSEPPPSIRSAPRRRVVPTLLAVCGAALLLAAAARLAAPLLTGAPTPALASSAPNVPVAPPPPPTATAVTSTLQAPSAPPQAPPASIDPAPPPVPSSTPSEVHPPRAPARPTVTAPAATASNAASDSASASTTTAAPTSPGVPAPSASIDTDFDDLHVKKRAEPR